MLTQSQETPETGLRGGSTTHRRQLALPDPEQPPPPAYERSSTRSDGEKSDVDSDADDAGNESAPPPGEDGPALKAAKTFGIGLGAIVAVPFAVAGVGVLAAGAAVYGAAKVLQGVGMGLAAGPEAAFRAVRNAQTSDGGGQAGAQEITEARESESKSKKNSKTKAKTSTERKKKANGA